jgi:hypothetical protein
LKPLDPQLQTKRIEAAGAMLMYLPAYSPDFNPIEMAFSKFNTVAPFFNPSNLSHWR